MTPTSWTENTVAVPGWVKGGKALDDGFCLFGMALPVSGSFVVNDISTTYSEMSQSATAYAETTQSATSWSEVSP